MKVQSILAVAAVAGMAASASAQFFTAGQGVSATVSMNWAIDTGSPNNGNTTLDTGERALIRTSIAFTGQSNIGTYDVDTEAFANPGTITRYNFTGFPGGLYTSGVILGLGVAYMDITSPDSVAGVYNGGLPGSSGPNANTSGTTGYGVRGGWRLGGDGANGSPAANGYVNVGPGQLPQSNSQILLTAPITNMHRLGWTPSSYAARTVTFGAAGAAGAGTTAIGLLCDFTGGIATNEFLDPPFNTVPNPQFGQYVPGTLGVVFIQLSDVAFGNVQIPLAPAPSSLALLGLGGLIAGRRRR